MLHCCHNTYCCHHKSETTIWLQNWFVRIIQPINLARALESNQTSGEHLEDKGATESPLIFLWGMVKLDQSCGRKHLLWGHRHRTSYIENEGVWGNTPQILDAYRRSPSTLGWSCSKRAQRQWPLSQWCCAKNPMCVVRSVSQNKVKYKNIEMMTY